MIPKKFSMTELSRQFPLRGLAAECGLSPQTLQNIENGAFAPRLDIVLTILSKLGARMTIKI